MRLRTPPPRRLIGALIDCAGTCVASESRRYAVTAACVTIMIACTAAHGGVLGVIDNGENIAALGAGVYAVSRAADRLRMVRSRSHSDQT
jgi:adenosine/AMP kinase